MYPGWILRVYHDSSIRPSTKCEIECLKHEGELIDIVDFCDIERMPDLSENYLTWNASYIHSAMWRWLTFGDHFVDVFSSRDIDGMIFQREIDSVNVWLNSTRFGHIMRGIFCFILILFNEKGIICCLKFKTD